MLPRKENIGFFFFTLVRNSLLHRTEFIERVKIIDPCSLTWGTELQVHSNVYIQG
jgi:hypothetical protein